ncbi:MAG: hypothetical protein JNK63_09830 [Chthonomonas sp.]|nr:hypothetical protein [Chthonomonas sp.]
MPIESEHAFEHHLRQASNAAINESIRAIQKHGPHNSYHESYGVLKEEHDELWDEIKASNLEPTRVYAEAIQVASVALRIAATARRQFGNLVPVDEVQV